MIKEQINKVWVDDTYVHAETISGLHAQTPISVWPKLRNGTPAQRQKFYLSYIGIHWPELDEDLGYEGIFIDAGLGVSTPTEDSFFYEPMI